MLNKYKYFQLVFCFAFRVSGFWRLLKGPGFLLKFGGEVQKIKTTHERLVIITGGPSLQNLDLNCEAFSSSDVFVNSYNTKIKQFPNQGVRLYYQAPWHNPINRNEHEQNIFNAVQHMQPKFTCIPEMESSGQNLKISSCTKGLWQFGILAHMQTGVHFLWLLGVKLGYKHITICGYDLTDFETQSERIRAGYNIENYCIDRLILAQEVKFLRQLSKTSGSIVEVLNKNSFYYNVQ